MKRGKEGWRSENGVFMVEGDQELKLSNRKESLRTGNKIQMGLP